MDLKHYQVSDIDIDSLLSHIENNRIAIPEIQRPFVWKNTKVRDLIDSLYKGFPVGYLISWETNNVELKRSDDAKHSNYNKIIIIDGQQRIIALTAALKNKKIIDEDYKERNIDIAFNPLTEEIAIPTAVTKNEKQWINSISQLFVNTDTFTFITKYLEDNSHFSDDEKKKATLNIPKLYNIIHNKIGLIKLNDSLDVDAVTEIFIRINSNGVVLKEADFAMSRLASNEEFNGLEIRKTIDYFSNLLANSYALKNIQENDKKYVNSGWLQKIEWVAKNDNSVFQPKYSDIARIAFTYEFQRGKMSDFVSLLSGKTLKDNNNEKITVKDTYDRFKNALQIVIKEYEFIGYIDILKSLGIVTEKLIRSQMTANFTYILYLTLRQQKCSIPEITKYVKKWYLLSALTGRYTGSPESNMDFDIKEIHNKGIDMFLKEQETNVLSDIYWNTTLIQQDLNTSVASSPFLIIYRIIQCSENTPILLSHSMTIDNVLRENSNADVHHLFPKQYLKNNDIDDRKQYNQIANMVFLQTNANIKIGGKKSPKEYFSEIKNNIAKYSELQNWEKILENLKQNDIPEEIINMEVNDYDTFLQKRRELIGKRIKRFYESI